MTAVGERIRRYHAADDTVAFEIELIHAFCDLPGIADRNLRQLPGLLRRAFIEDSHAEAGADAGRAGRLSLGGRIAAAWNRDRALAGVELIAADGITRHIVQQQRVVETEADNRRVVASNVVKLRAAGIKTLDLERLADNRRGR